MRPRLSRLLRLLLPAALVFASASAFAWPDRPIRLVVGFAAGGVADVAARVVAEQLSRKLGQPVTIDNKAGAGGRLATDAVAKAEPDGYTIGLLVGGDAVVAASDPKLPYNLSRDFQYVTTLSVYPFVVAAAPQSQVGSIPQILELAKKTPGALRFATPGRGTTQHLAGELMGANAAVEMTDVPYRGSAAAMTDVLTARVDFTIAAYSTLRGDIQAGKLKALAVTSKERYPTLPNVPAVSEFIPGFDVATWMGIVAPARTPASVIEQLNKELREVVNMPSVKEKFIAQGLDPQTGTGAEMKARVEADVTRWRQLMQVRKIDLTQ